MLALPHLDSGTKQDGKGAGTVNQQWSKVVARDEGENRNETYAKTNAK